MREAARAEATAGREAACALLEQALSLTSDPRARAEIALELANVYAELSLQVEAFDRSRVFGPLAMTNPPPAGDHGR